MLVLVTGLPLPAWTLMIACLSAQYCVIIISLVTASSGWGLATHLENSYFCNPSAIPLGNPAYLY